MTTSIDPSATGLPPAGYSAPPRRRVALDEDECLRLLGSIRLGRIVFTSNALPVIRPVNHALLNGRIILRTHEGAALMATASLGLNGGVVVAYEADVIDPDTHTGWSVIVTGRARLVTGPEEVEIARQLLIPWVDEPMDHIVVIRPELVTGFRME